MYSQAITKINFRIFSLSQKEISAHLQSLTIFSPLPPSPRQPLIHFLPLYICLFWTSHKNRIIQYVVLWGWLLSVSIVQAIVGISALFLFIAK